MIELNTKNRSANITQDLVEFYEGRTPDPRRHFIEEFLLNSQVGLMEFFAIKRDRELPALDGMPPSDLTKARLKREVRKLRAEVFVSKKSILATAAAVLLILGALFLRDNLSVDQHKADSAAFLSIDSSGEIVAGATTLM